jgi:hypothetical protein
LRPLSAGIVGTCATGSAARNWKPVSSVAGPPALRPKLGANGLAAASRPAAGARRSNAKPSLGTPRQNTAAYASRPRLAASRLQSGRSISCDIRQIGSRQLDLHVVTQLGPEPDCSEYDNYVRTEKRASALSCRALQSDNTGMSRTVDRAGPLRSECRVLSMPWHMPSPKVQKRRRQWPAASPGDLWRLRDRSPERLRCSNLSCKTGPSLPGPRPCLPMLFPMQRGWEECALQN